jgi:hypothetical protein
VRGPAIPSSNPKLAFAVLPRGRLHAVFQELMLKVRATGKIMELASKSTVYRQSGQKSFQQLFTQFFSLQQTTCQKSSAALGKIF